MVSSPAVRGLLLLDATLGVVSQDYFRARLGCAWLPIWDRGIYRGRADVGEDEYRGLLEGFAWGRDVKARSLVPNGRLRYVKGSSSVSGNIWYKAMDL